MAKCWYYKLAAQWKSPCQRRQVLGKRIARSLFNDTIGMAQLVGIQEPIGNAKPRFLVLSLCIKNHRRICLISLRNDSINNQ